MPLTDSMARNAKPAAKTVRMFDRDGLYLEVSPRGGKWWRLKYRYAGKEKRVSLGVYPEVNLKKARARTIERSGASKSAVRWRPRIGRSAIAARCSAVPSPPDAPTTAPRIWWSAGK